MFSISKLFASSDDPNSLGAYFRKKRLQQFEQLFFNQFDVNQQVKILDVGGTDYFWKGSSLLDHPKVEITLLNLHLEESSHPAIKSTTGDATNLQEYQENEFDLIFSNSVIEHLFTWENQQKMAAEIERVGKKHFVQTPNRYFPIEAHYALPYAQYWPEKLLFHTLTRTPLSRFRKWSSKEASDYIAEIRLLDEKELQRLFPSSEILKEKVAGLTKSITAHNLL
ncbi:class I SAM-dependent methyltransferase [uncultured Algoriphagus sp.]|uniref:class I SAM-dependent methyltransferase n=1 Tax=uncultured Algoriphagus sp. TaxID=417365 RepID=UPI00258649C4|nr:class I SAM-dependent methyltransferase [uncultured Algoriphagus sp.]